MKVLKDLLKSLGDARKRLIFISFPYAADPELNRKKAMIVSKYWWKKGFIPICPVVILSYMADDRDRQVIMILSKIFILLCPGFKLYGLSSGCREEFRFAKKHHREISVLIPEEEKINFKRMMEKNREVML